MWTGTDAMWQVFDWHHSSVFEVTRPHKYVFIWKRIFLDAFSKTSTLGTVLKNLRFQWKRSHLFIVLVWTEDENASIKMRFQMNTYSCGRGLKLHANKNLTFKISLRKCAVIFILKLPSASAYLNTVELKWTMCFVIGSCCSHPCHNTTYRLKAFVYGT